MTDWDRVRQTLARRVQTALPEMVARIDWPRERLDAHREASLRTLLGHLIERSPWHRERLAGVDPGAFRLDDLAELPTMSKADLMGNFDAISTDPRITLARCEAHIGSGGGLLDDEFVVVASGGSSGVRSVNANTLSNLAQDWPGGLVRFAMRWARRSGALSGPPSPMIVAAGQGAHGSSMVRQLFGSGPSASVLDPIEDVVAAINQAAPEVLAVYASFVPRLLDEARAGRLRVRPRLLAAVAEPFLSEHESAIAEVWGCATMAGYAASEVGGLGTGSGFESGMLLHDDQVIVEPVDAAGRPVAPGERADKLFVTRLQAGVVPVLRYELTDQLTVLDGPPVCGSSFTRVGHVLGRLDDEFVYAGGVRVHPHVFRTVLGRHGTINEYQVEQTGRGAVVRVVLGGAEAAPDREAVVRELAEHLVRLGVAEAEVRVEVVAQLPRSEASGKLKRFVPLRSGAP